MKNSFLTLIQNGPATDFEYTGMIQEHLPGHIKAVWVGKGKIPWHFAYFWSNFWEAVWFERYDGGSSNQKTWILFLALSLTWRMTQDKWLPHICQVSESKCETHTIPFSPQLSLHSPSFPHICSTAMTSVTPHDTLHKLSNHLLTFQPAVPGVQNPKAEGKVQSSELVLSKALLQLSMN